MTLLDHATTSFVPVCVSRRLTPDRGVAALIDGQPVAVFRLSTGELHAVDNIDPISGANVLSRGLVGDVSGSATVASPLYKQRFDLRTGRCLDVDDVTIAVHEVQEVDGMVHVRLSA